MLVVFVALVEITIDSQEIVELCEKINGASSSNLYVCLIRWMLAIVIPEIELNNCVPGKLSSS